MVKWDEIIKRELKDSFDVIQFDNMEWKGVGSHYTTENLDELVTQCNELIPSFEKDEILGLKCGEMFN